MNIRNLPIKPALAASLLALLASCAAEPQTDATQTQTAPAATSPDSIEMTSCNQPSQGRVHFRLGTSTMRVPAQLVRDAIPSNIEGPLKKENVERILRERIGDGQGCPESPLQTELLILTDDLGHPLLEGTVGLVRSPNNAITKRRADLTRQLQRERADQCRPMNGSLIACSGVETQGERQTQVMYVISTNTNLVMNSGAPLSARCILGESGIRGCNLVDTIGGGITFDATLSSGDYTSDGLEAARQAAIQKLNGYRL